MRIHTWMSRKSLSTAKPGKLSKNKISTYSNMNKKNLEKYTKEELIEMLLQTQKPKQKTKKSNRMENIIREMLKSEIPNVIKSNILDKKYHQLVNPKKVRLNIRKLDQALENFTRSYEVPVIANKNPLIQLNRTRNGIYERMLKTLRAMKGMKMLETIKITLEKTSNKITTTYEGYFNSKNQVILNEIDLQNALNVSIEQIMNKIGIWVSEGSGWVITAVNKHYINVATYKPTSGSSYIDLPPELKSRKATVNLRNEDNECFRWCHIRHLNMIKDNPHRITPSDKKFVDNNNDNL